VLTDDDKEVGTLVADIGAGTTDVAIPQSYTVDGSDVGLNVVGCPGKSLGGTFYVVIGRANAVQKIRQAIEMAGLKVLKIVLQSIASGDAVLTDDDKEVGTLVADIGAGTTDVAIYQDMLLRDISVIPFGGNSITDDIKSACQILSRKAETLKIQHASAIPEAQFDKTLVVLNNAAGRSDKEVSLADIAAITNARMDEIVAGIANVLNESKYGDKISQIAITGGGSRLKNLFTLVKYRLGRDVQQAKPRNISADSYPKLFNVEYSTAVGLLVKGIEYMENYNERLKNIENKPEDNKEDKPKTSQDGKETKGDDKKKKKSDKKTGLMSWLSTKFKDFFSEDEETSKL
jgi:cell division protein FtsA